MTRRVLDMGDKDVPWMVNTTTDGDPNARPAQRSLYAWPLLWVLPGALILTFLMFRDGICRRCLRRARRRRMRDGAGTTTRPRATHDSSSSSSTSSVEDAAEARELLSVLRRAEEGSARGEDNASLDAWRQLSMQRESDFMRRSAREDDEESEHRRAIMTLPEGVLTRSDEHRTSFYEQYHKRIRPAPRWVINKMPRCVVGSPRWWQFLRATNSIETRVINDKGEKETAAIELECPICVETLEAEEIAIITRCQHAYHQRCLCDWLRLHASCPTCRQEVTRMSLVDRMAAFTKLKSCASAPDASSASASWAA